VVDEMNRLFCTLKGKLKDIFRGQKRLRQEVSKVQEIERIKRSFAREMGGIGEKKE
jgi:hypothetical protein